MTWRPDHTTEQRRPEVGQFLGWEHAVWRVIEVRDTPECDWTNEQRRRIACYKMEFRYRHTPFVAVVRPIHIAADDPRAVDHDLHLECTDPSRASWRVYQSPHYPVCVRCGEPTPCRDWVNEQTARAELANMARYETAGVCPVCGGVVTERQKQVTFPVNLIVPVGPPVTFHLRARCKWGAERYRERLAEADPTSQARTVGAGGEVG